VNAIFNVANADEIKMPVQSIQGLVDAYRDHRKTGIIQLAYASEMRLYLFFKRGELINTYLVTPTEWQAFPPERGVEWMQSAGDAYAKPLPLSALGMLISKLLFQSSSGRSESFLSPEQLNEHLEKASHEPQPVLVQVNWENAGGAILFSPQSAPSFIFISQEMVLDETGSFKVFSEWHEKQGSLTFFTPNLSIEAWQEYYLRNVFADLCGRILGRFEILTGRSLVDSVLRLIIAPAARQNLDIAIAPHSLLDREVFPSPDEAARSYRFLLNEMFENFSAVIGVRLYVSILREIVNSLPEQERGTIQTFALLPKGY
jgi:hypothetical protein